MLCVISFLLFLRRSASACSLRQSASSCRSLSSSLIFSGMPLWRRFSRTRSGDSLTSRLSRLHNSPPSGLLGRLEKEIFPEEDVRLRQDFSTSEATNTPVFHTHHHERVYDGAGTLN